MKNTGKILALLLAIACIFSTVSLTAFADSDSALESPIIPVGPGVSEWFEYEYTEEPVKTAILTGFSYKSGRQNVVVRNTVTKDDVTYNVVGIADDVFKGTAIKSVTIQEGVKTIGKGAFENCEQLATVEIASTVDSIDPTAFDGTAWLANQPEGLVYAGKVAYKVKGVAPESITLNAGTVAIADKAFAGQTSLKKIIIPAATTIGATAFEGCTDVVFYCFEDSPAHAYAVANEIDFVLIPSLVLKSLPTKTEYYQDDALVFNGIELVYITEAGETAVEVLPEMVSGYDAAVLGTQTVVITYEGKTVSFPVTVIERPAFIPGDVDGTGVVDVDDVIQLLFNLTFPESYPVNQPTDFDGSGSVDVDDVIQLLFFLTFPDSYPLH